MKDATIERVEKDIADWAFLAELPAEVSGFTLRREGDIVGDKYRLFSYANEASHRALAAYYHEETDEYKLAERIGLLEFCIIEFITPKLAVFDEMLRRELIKRLENLADFAHDLSDLIIAEQHTDTWEYGHHLPERLEGFELLVRPATPLKYTNGSYLVINYVDFAIGSDFSLMYNAYREEFFGEGKVRGVPDVNYLFDSKSLAEAEKKLDAHLAERLREIRRLAEAKG